MRSGIVYYILLLLDANDAVNVPLVGRLNKRVYPAKADLEGGHVYPPHATIQFSSDRDEQDQLLQQYIAYAAGISEEEAGRQLEAFGNDFREELERKNKAAIDYLGVFYKRGDNVLFEPDQKTAGLSYEGLQKVNLPKPVVETVPEDTAVIATEAQAAVAVAPVQTIQSEQVQEDKDNEPEEPETGPSRFRPLDGQVAWLAGLFAVIFVLVAALAISNYTSRQGNKYPTSAFNRAPMPEPIISPTSDDTMPDTNSAEPISGAETVSEPDLDSDIMPTEASEEPDLPDTAEAVAKANKPGGSNGPEPSTSLEEVADDMTSAADTEEDKAFSTEQTVPGCHVVVGAFGMNSNVERMMERLKDLGYAVDTMSKGSLTQVGVPAPCGSEEIERLLSELRTEIESQAWILKK